MTRVGGDLYAHTYRDKEASADCLDSEQAHSD